MKTFVFNGWAAGPAAWSLCRFPRERVFSYVEQLDGVPDRLLADERKVLLVGWSMGGEYALRLALSMPEKIGGLVLVAATARMMEDPESGWRGMSARRLKAFEAGAKLMHGESLFGVPPGIPNPYVADTDENLRRGLDFLRDTDLREELLRTFAGADFPVSVFQSEKDGIVRPENAAFLQRVFPRATTVMAPGGEHALPVRIPELIDRAVEAMATGKKS